MSFSSSYLEKRKKRLKEREKQLDNKLNNDIAPVGGNKDSWFKGGALSDGYEFGDITKTILGTSVDAGIGIVKGAGRMVEGLADAATYGVAGVAELFGADSFAEDARDVAKFSATDEFTAPVTDYVDKFSLLGNKADSVTEGLGQVGTILLTGGAAGAAGLGSTGVTAVTTGVTGLSSMGSGMSQAYTEGATDEEALTYGVIAGVAEAGTELLFGGLGKAVGAVGLSKGISSLDDALAKKVSSKIANQTMKNFAEFGIKAGAEGTEEVISGILQAFGKKATYMSEEDLGKLLKDEKLLDSFIVGTITSGITQSGIVPGMKRGSLIEANKQGADFITGHTETEQKVIDKVTESSVTEREKELGRKLNAKERAEIEEDVETKLIKGGISIDTIEETLGGDSYKAYKEATEKQEALKKELNELRNMKKGEMTDIQTDRLTELKAMDLEDTSKVDELKAKASQDVFELIKADRKGQGSILAESYNERERRGVAFEVDTNKVDSKKADTYKRAMEAGVLNNTNATHDFVDLVATLEAEKGVKIDFSNNEKLKASGFAVDGAEINGVKTNGGIILNANSRKNLNVVVGHEITHILEGTELYTALKDTIISYAKSKGDYDARYKATSKLYEKVKDADIDGEITADLVGEYLFTDEKFIKNLTTNKNLFKKVYDEIKYLVKVATAGSAEKKQLLKVQRAFEKAFETSTTEKKADANNEASELVSIDTTSESVSPMFSLSTWTESEYVVSRDQAAKKIAKALGVTESKALKYIDDINSVAKMIANDRVRLDYEASSFGSAFVSNVEYGGSFDYTTLCKKRRIYTGTFTEIQKRLKDVALTPDDILKIRNMLIEEGIEATCGLCYVEGSRANMGKFAKEFIRLYKRDNPQAWIPNMADVNTPDGVEQMRISHPEAYEQYVHFWNHYGKLKDSDPALFASQQKPKLYEARKEYKGEILEHFKGDSTVAKKNRNGGIRMQSFSDFEIVHLIDTMQVIMDMSTVGLAGQAYTKVPEFAKAFGNTGLKINLSLIAKGVDADGNLIFDDLEGMPHETAFDLRNRHSKNVGTIIVTFTDEQLLAAMADPRIDFIIPFHRSQWKKGQYGAMGLPKGTKDYTYMQNEKLIKQTYHEYRGRMVKDKASNYMPNEYWDFSKSGKENAEAYLKMCAENNKRPKFYKFLDYDGKGTYSLKADGSTDGYWKLLIDFKMYDNDGVGSPQNAVTPTFNMDEAMSMLDEYQGGHSKYPVAHSVVDRFVNQYEGNIRYSLSDIAPEDGTSDRDTDYLDAVNRGDMVTAQRMVDEVANKSMPHSLLREGKAINKGEEQDGTLIKMFHGSGSNGFYEFALHDGMLGKGVYVTSNWDEAVGYAMEKLGIEEDEDGGYEWNGETFDGIGSIGEILESEGYVRAFYANVTDANDISTSPVYWEDVIALVRDNNSIKSADPVTYDDNGEVIPLSERFKADNNDIRYSLSEIAPEGNTSGRDSLGNELSAEQQEYFKDSKVRDENGNLLVVYHGSASEFTVFNKSKIGAHGSAHGHGFYFTENEGLASSYHKEGGQLLKGYLNITNPVSEEKLTIKKNELLKLIKAICEQEARNLVADDEYSTVTEALRDTFISNYVNTYEMSLAEAYREVADIIYPTCDNDTDLLGELFNSGARGLALEKTREVLGYDGVIYTNVDGVHEYVAFESNQFKNADNKTPTSDPDIRYSLSEIEDMNLSGRDPSIDKLLESLDLEDLMELWGGDDISFDDISEKLNVKPEVAKILIRRKGLGESHIEAGRMAVMKQTRIDEAIEDSGAKFHPGYARKYITRISPKDYIDLTVSQDHLDRGQFDAVVKGDHGSRMSEYDYEKALQDNRSPYLSVDHSTGKVIGHNGRHRIRALEMAGIEAVEIEVSFYDEDGDLIKYDANTIPDMAISSQFDTAIETHLSNIIPLNETHREEIERTYGEKAHPDAGVKYSLSEIVAEDGTSYGIGVKLDSTLLDNLEPKDRISLVKEYVRELQGKVFTAFDEDGEPVDISIAEGNKRFRNSNGNRVATNKDLTTKHISKETKQEAIALIDELVSTASYQGSEAARHPHDWLDNDGNNEWDKWTTYIQDKNNTIWEATLHIANTTNGEKILYDISLIKKAEQSGKSDTSLLTLGQSGESDTIPDDNSIAPLPENVKMGTKFSLSDTEDIAPVDNDVDNVDNVDIAPIAKKYSDIKEQIKANEEKLESLMAEYEKIANMVDNGEMSKADFDFRAEDINKEYKDTKNMIDSLTYELTVIEENNVTVTDAIKNYSKKDALTVVERMGTYELTKAARKKLADALWEGMNKNTTVEQREAFAKEFAKTATETIVEKSRAENPNYNNAKEQLPYIASGIGRLTFTADDMAELKHKYDKDLKKFLGRWGYKGGTYADGTPKRKYPMSQFVIDYARETAGMSYLEDMHHAEAMFEINELYEDLSAEVKNRWVNSYEQATKEEIEFLKADIEKTVLKAFETEGRDARVKKGLEAAYDKIDKQFEADKASLDKAFEKGKEDALTMNEKDRSNYIANLEERYAMRLAELTEQVKREKELAKKESERVRRKDLHNSIIGAIKTEYATRGLDFDEVLDKAKRKGNFASVDNTPQRFIEKTLGYKEGQILNDLTVNKIALNESAGIKWLNGQVNNIRKLSEKYNIKPGSKESAAAQMYGEGFYVNKEGEYVKYGDAELAKDFPSIEVQNNIKALAKNSEVRRMYDETLDAINASRVRNGYPEIPKRADYFLHFRAMDDTFSRLGIPFNPNDIKAKDLPTDINGMTANLKPGQPYFASANRRMGINTTYDLLGGIERYMNSAKNQIYHIDDIQTLRAVRNYVADRYGQANGLNDLDSMTPDEQEARIKDVYDGHLSTFAKFLNEEANIIAGKTSLMDRSVEGIFGRRAMQVLNTINSQVGKNMVGFNISSAGTNFLPLVQAAAKLRKSDMIKAFSQTISNKFNSDGFVENDPALIRRKGADKFSRKAWEKASDIGYVLMSAVDNLTSEVIVRAKYNELTRNGLDNEQAHIKAGEWASRLMGDRSLGQMPQLFNSKTLGIFTKFQLEVRNQLDSMFYDSFQEAKESTENIQDAKERNVKTAAKVASTLAQLFVFQHIFGMVYEQIAGYNPTFDILSTLATLFGWDDEEESEDTFGDNLQQAFNELLEDLPYTSTFTGGRIPMSAALPIEQLLTGKDEWGNEVSQLETLAEIAPYYLLPTGYGQFKKTRDGLRMFSDEHPIAGSYTDSGNLRFPVEETPLNIAQAAVFGQYANKNAREYFDNDYAPLTPNQVEEFMATGMSYSEYSKKKKAKKIKEAKAKELIYSLVGGEDLYQEYTDALSEIKAGVYVDRKTRVLGYLNSLDIDYVTKLILYKKQFPNDKRFNVALVNNLNERDDISYSEMEAILTELGFQVDEDGNIKW